MKAKPHHLLAVAGTRLAWALFLSLTWHGLVCVVLFLWPGPTAQPAASLDPCQVGFWGLEEAEESEASAGYGVAEGTIDPGPIATAVLGNPADSTVPPLILAGPSPAGEGSPADPHILEKGQVLSVKGPGSSGSGGVATTFFQVEARGQKIVYVLDGSASMGQSGAWQVAGRELLASLHQLPPKGRFQVIVYNRFASFLLPQRPEWLDATPENVAAAAQALANLPAEGKTEHGPALQKALALRPDVLFFLTDADDLTNEHLRLVAACNQQRAVIHTIELNTSNRQRTDMPMQVLARAHHGVYRAVDLFGKMMNDE